MPLKGSRKQFRRGEVVQVAGDVNNEAFKAIKTRKRASTKFHPSIEKETIEIDSDDEKSQPPKKSRPDPRSSTSRIRGAKQEERLAESKQESETVDRPQNIIYSHIIKPSKLFRPFAEKDANVYIVLAPGDSKYCYRMQSHVLMHASPWFKWPIRGRVQEADPKLAEELTQNTGIEFRFELILDKHLGHYALKRMPLTKYKPVEQLQEGFTEAFPSNGSKRQHSFSNSICQNGHPSTGLPQYDGSFDEVVSENIVGSFDAATQVETEHLNSLLGTDQSLFELQVKGNQDEKDVIKLEEDTDMQLTSIEIALTQKATKEQIATRPTSPIKTGIGPDNNDTKHTVHIHPDSHNITGGQDIIILETPIKAEAGIEEQISLQVISVARAFPEEQPETFVEDEFNPDKQHQEGEGFNQLQSGHQTFPEEQLQTVILAENPGEPEIKLEEPDLQAELSVQASSSATVSPTEDVEDLANATIPLKEKIEEPANAASVVEQPRQAVDLFSQESSNDRALPTKAKSTLEEPKQATTMSSKTPCNSQGSPRNPVRISAGPKLTETRNQSVSTPVVEEAPDDQRINKPEVCITVEPRQITPEQYMKEQSEEPVHPPILDAYHSLFLCYYGFPPTISNTDLPTALKQSRLLVKIATLYASLKHVRPHIIASLLSHGRNLYSSIAQDAPRFLILAKKLQCAPIFKEAMIHIVGQVPFWPWPTPEDQVDPMLVDFIQRKSDDLKDKKAEANDALFRSCLTHLGVRVSINNLERATFDMWVVVQIWHDWFSQQLHTCAVIRHNEGRNAERNMYRLMAQDGEAYLKTDDIMAMVEPYKAVSGAKEWGNWDRNQVEKEMQIMKGFAAKTVKGLMANELMGDISENGEGAVEYLVCTKIDERELPINHPEHDLMKSDITLSNHSSINASRFPPISFPSMVNASIARLLCKPSPL
ncbi:hypothetical protein EYC80_002389 [Monilinia laxa]|uniref:BTB domain-containing protein n=1 Tax=Monilinia laxa TaxID=61186 RepID=A0A5N6K3T3_MONLA|nr:hypothetical protein EYC80_002389 [Monilinia laxa]